MRTSHFVLPAVLVLAGCTGNTLIPEPERVQLKDELVGHARYLRVACWVTPFFHDDGKLLITDEAPDELDLVDRPNGTPVDPGQAIGILPPGTRLRIEAVSFPTALEMADRLVMTPRYNPWVFLTQPDQFGANVKPYVLVLHQDIHSRDEFLQELGRFLTDVDPTPELKAFPPAVQAAIAKKTLIAGMTLRQVEMAWGYPERIHIDGPTHAQTWSWPDDKQRAWFSSDALAHWMDHGKGDGAQ
ncbi:MAG TPA: hypothetical protein VMB50_20180 [Myxococcales bacterium]|nr:hypothetical protein [Myxococcales bacterium]